MLEQVKTHPKLRAIPIVMLTSSREESDIVRSYEQGVNSFVVKPVNFNSLLRGHPRSWRVLGVLNEPMPGDA